MTTFDEVRPIADTVLYEGYVLYPYRADDAKNRVRWQFGVLAPPALSAADSSEKSHLRAELLLERHPVGLTVRLRFLQVQRRTVQQDLAGALRDVPALDTDDTTYLPFDEAVAHDVDLEATLSDLVATPRVDRVEVPGGLEVEPVAGGQLRRERLSLRATVTMGAEPLPGPYGVTRLRVEVHNETDWQPEGDSPRREQALRGSLVAAHLLVRLEQGQFLSLTDPPEWAAGYVAGCDNDGVWPVLAGAEGGADLVLCSPIILPDHPEVAPESTTAFYDSTEMDEMLSLRALTLTEQEKRAVRGTDPRAAELLDQVEHLPRELMDRLHGAVRYLQQTPRREATGARDPGVLVDGVAIREGSRVLLRPGARRADAQDLFLAGQRATVAKVVHDLDGNDHVAVLLDDDPGRDVARLHGRFLYFAPDEVQPLEVAL